MAQEPLRYYSINNLDSRHVAIMEAALDMYARVHLGQLDVIAQRFVGQMHVVAYHELTDKLKQCEPLITNRPANGYPSIRHPEVPEQAKVAYEMGQAIKRELGSEKNFLLLSVSEVPKISISEVL